MKKKIVLIITIVVCIVSVSANVYQHRVIQNKDAQIVWDQNMMDQRFQDELAFIGDQMIRLSECESGEKDTEIGRTLGYCLAASDMYQGTSYGAFGEEHEVDLMVAEFRDYLENLQSDETLWKNAKSGDLDRLHDAWSEVLTQIDKGKKARVAAASKARQILKEYAEVDTSGKYDNTES